MASRASPWLDVTLSRRLARVLRPPPSFSESAGVAEVHELPDRVVLMRLEQLAGAIP